MSELPAASEASGASIPIVDVTALVRRTSGREGVAAEIGRACREHGFFYVVGHGVDEGLRERLERASRAFFALDRETKMRWRMELGGRAWRGYFPLGGELTSGRPDWKEGLYFGAELGPEHLLVRANTPLHGRNLFPDVPGLREAVLEYIDALTRLGHVLVEGIALALGLEPSYFADRYTREPLILFRVFDYPSQPVPPGAEVAWGVGEHTDYGLLTMLWQDEVGGLEIRTRDGWIPAPPVPRSLVCNIGDMLDRMTGGAFRSTPHRVALNRSGRDRLSLTFFFDPDSRARVQPIPGVDPTRISDDSGSRWDHASVHAFEGTYGDYLLAKVSKVFPDLRRDVL